MVKPNRAKLFKYINANLRKPYERGKNDCIISTFKALDIFHGTKITGEFYAKYSTQDDSFILLKKYGWINGLFDHLKLMSICPSILKLGDIIKTCTLHEPLCLGIYIDDYKANPGVLTVDVNIGTCITILPKSFTSWKISCQQ